MLTNLLIERYNLDLDKLKNEISQYQNEADLWKVAEGISNSGGNLCLHLLGNLNHFIGAMLGNTGYIRQREKEFSDKDVPKQELLDNIELLKGTIDATLAGLTQDDLNKTYPLQLGGRDFVTDAFLLHLNAHLNYHIGQINYHRRLVGNN